MTNMKIANFLVGFFLIELVLLLIHGTEYVILTKGPAISVTHSKDGLEINNSSCSKVNCSSDNIYMVTVSATSERYKPPLLPITYYLLFEKERSIYPYSALYGNEENIKANSQESFFSSIDNANIAAFNYIGEKYTISPVVTSNVNFTFTSLLNPADIVSVNGKAVKNLDELTVQIRKHKNAEKIVLVQRNGLVYNNAILWQKSPLNYGDILTQVDNKGDFSIDKVNFDGYLEYMRDGKKYRTDKSYASLIPIISSKHPVLRERGLYMGFRNSDIGGESAGGAIATSIIDILKYNGKHFAQPIAITGAIESNGSITTIGGAPLKGLSVLQQHIKIFFIPKDNCEEMQSSSSAIKNKLRKLKIVKTNSLSDIFNTDLNNIDEQSLCKV